MSDPGEGVSGPGGSGPGGGAGAEYLVETPPGRLLLQGVRIILE